MKVLTFDEWQGALERKDKDCAEHAWFVEFATSAGENEALARVQAAGQRAHRHVVDDYAGRAVLSIITRPENLFQNN
jgi:hypothetical protein